MDQPTDTITVPRQDILDLFALLDGRAADAIDAAKAHARHDEVDLSAYTEGKATGYRGAARAARFILGDIK